MFCLQEDRWISLPPMPTPRAGAAVAVLGKQLLVVGGVGEDQSPLKAVEIYNTEEGRWRKRSALREALMGISISVKGSHSIMFKQPERLAPHKSSTKACFCLVVDSITPVLVVGARVAVPDFIGSEFYSL